MKIATCSANLALLALIAAGLLAVPPETQAQAPPENPENFAWITNTNGVTWKKEIRYISSYGSRSGASLNFESEKIDKPKIASILVPEHAEITAINVKGCVNLTNLVIQPARSGYYVHVRTVGQPPTKFFRDKPLVIEAENSGLRNITAQKTMANSIVFEFHHVRHNDFVRIPALALTIQWTEPEPEPAPIEIITHATDNGPEVEVIWRDGTLQIADAVNGEYRDHLGSSPLRFPLLSAKDMQFYRIGRSEPPTTEEPPTPQTLGGNR